MTRSALPGRNRTEIIGRIGLVLTLILIGLITLTPQAPDSPHSGLSAALLHFLHSIGVPQGFGPEQWEFTANIIMFTPLGFFLPLALTPRFYTRTRTRTRTAQTPTATVGSRTALEVIVCALLLCLISVVIELCQFFFLPSRVPTAQDVLANSLGGWLGLAVGLFVLHLTVKKGNRKT